MEHSEERHHKVIVGLAVRASYTRQVQSGKAGLLQDLKNQAGTDLPERADKRSATSRVAFHQTDRRPFGRSVIPCVGD